MKRVIEMLQAGKPVPLDVIFKLAERGIDYSELERKYAT